MTYQIPTVTAATLVPQQRYQTSDISAFYGVLDSPVMAYGSDAIGGGLYNVLSTLVGDEIGEPTYGCDLILRVFEPITPATTILCRQDVYFASINWAQNAQVNDEQTVAWGDTSNRLVGVEIAYNYGGAQWTLGAPLNLAFGAL